MRNQESRIQEKHVIKGNEEHGDYIVIESHIGIEEYEVEDVVGEYPTSSWTELKMYNHMDEEVGSISLNNSEAVYLARKILDNLIFID